ncbi:MAG: ParA family partition ATPase [Novosphingobium sp.]
MPTIAIVSQKGGSGKTTVTVNLAVTATAAGRHVCVIDTDPQATAAAWGDWRENDRPEVMTSPPARLGKTIQAAVKAGAELILIDTPPHADAAAREAVKAADLVLIPTRPRAFDLHAVEATADLVSFAKKPAFVVFNAVPPRATLLITEVSEFVEQLGLKICPVRLGERAAFHHYSSAGEVAGEGDPEGKAAGEVGELWQWVCQQLGEENPAPQS